MGMVVAQCGGGYRDGEYIVVCLVHNADECLGGLEMG
jgi:hypothetical protein